MIYSHYVSKGVHKYVASRFLSRKTKDLVSGSPSPLYAPSNHKMSHSKELHWFYKPCNEVLHAKTPSHLQFTGRAFLYPFIAALKLYSPLYLVTHIIGRKSFQHLVNKTLPAIIRSSSFLCTSN